MPQVVTQLIVDASGATLGVAEFNRAMSEAKRIAIEGGNATATSFERTQQAWTKSLGATDPIIKAQIAMERDLARQRVIGADAVRLGIASQEAAAKQLDNVRQKHEQLIQATRTNTAASAQFGKAVGLNQYELLNLNRQINDVAVSLASGQSPFVVLTQQGSQIYDVFAQTRGSVQGFFSQAIEWGGRFVRSTAGVVTGIAAIAAAVVALRSSWGDAQTEINRTLIGPGRASGASRDDINRIAESSADASKQSISQSRELALALAATGKIGVEQIGELSKHGYALAKILGVDLPEANKIWAESFADPAKGADILGDKLGGVTANMREDIKRLAAKGLFDEARAALLSGVIPTLNRAGEAVTGFGRVWDATAKVVSDALTRMNQGFDRLTGANPLQERLASEQSNLAGIQGAMLRRAESGNTPNLLSLRPGPDRAMEDLIKASEKAKENIRALQEEINRVNGERFGEVRNAVIAVADAIDPMPSKINKMRDSLENLNKALSNPDVLKGMSETQIEQASRSRDILKDQVAEVDRLKEKYGNVNTAVQGQADAVNGLRGAYGGINVEVARQIEMLQLQARLARAPNDAAQDAIQLEIRKLKLKQQNTTAAEQESIAIEQGAAAAAQMIGRLQEAARARELSRQIALQTAQLDASLVGVDPQRAEVARLNLQAQQQILQTLVPLFGQAGAAAVMMGNQSALATQFAADAYKKLEADIGAGAAAAVKAGVDVQVANQAVINEYNNQVVASQAKAAQIIADYQKESMAARQNADEVAAAGQRKRSAEQGGAGGIGPQRGAGNSGVSGNDSSEALEREARERTKIAQDQAKENDRSNQERQRRDEEAHAQEVALQEQSVLNAQAAYQQMVNAAQEAAAAAQRAYDKAYDQLAFLPFLVIDEMAALRGAVLTAGLFQKDDGSFSQFDPKGYESTTTASAIALTQATQAYGQGGFEKDPNDIYGYGISFQPNSQGKSFMANNAANASNFAFSENISGGQEFAVNQAVRALLNPEQGSSGLTSIYPETMQAVSAKIDRYLNLRPEEEQAKFIKEELEVLKKAPDTLEREELTHALNERLEQLTKAVDDNTDALQAKLDPLFSQGHDFLDKLRIGYYKAAAGLEGIVGGSGGADSQRFVMDLTPGELVQITPPGQQPSKVSNDNSKNVTQHITFNIKDSSSSTGRLTTRQRLQGYIGAAARAAG